MSSPGRYSVPACEVFSSLPSRFVSCLTYLEASRTRTENVSEVLRLWRYASIKPISGIDSEIFSQLCDRERFHGRRCSLAAMQGADANVRNIASSPSTGQIKNGVVESSSTAWTAVRRSSCAAVAVPVGTGEPLRSTSVVVHSLCDVHCRLGMV